MEVPQAGCPRDVAQALWPSTFRLQFWKCIPCGGQAPSSIKAWGGRPPWKQGPGWFWWHSGLSHRCTCSDGTRAIPLCAPGSGWWLTGVQHKPSLVDCLSPLAFSIQRLLSRYFRKSKDCFHGLSAINTLTPLILVTECLHAFLLIKAGKRLWLHMH